MNQLSRRNFLKTLGVTAGSVVLSNCTSKPVNVQPLTTDLYGGVSDIPEVQSVRLGIIPSVEVAPLLVAQNQKLFAKYGMTNVELVPFGSWQEICDRTELGGENDGIDGGHFYSPLPELLNEGLIKRYSRKTAMYTLMRLHTHGGYITVSPRLRPFGIQVQRAPFTPFQNVAKLFGSPMNCAIAEIGSNYDLWLRYWLASMSIIPKLNIDVLEIPFDKLIPQLKKNKADLLCLDSWHTLKLSEAKLAYPAIATAEIWHNHPGELLAMRADWVDKYPIATQALIQGIMEAQIWCDDLNNAKELNTLLALSFSNGRDLVLQPLEMFSQLFKNSPRLVQPKTRSDAKGENKAHNTSDRFQQYPIKYWSNDGISVSYPYKSHDLWFLTEYRRWGLVTNMSEIKETIDAVNREDLWKNAAKAIGVPDTNIPISNSRGVEVFFDSAIFDPKEPDKYLTSKLTGISQS